MTVWYYNIEIHEYVCSFRKILQCVILLILGSYSFRLKRYYSSFCFLALLGMREFL